MTYLGAGGIRLFFFDLFVETSRPPVPLMDSSKLVSFVVVFDAADVVLSGFDRVLRKRLNADDDEDDADALIAASN